MQDVDNRSEAVHDSGTDPNGVKWFSTVVLTAATAVVGLIRSASRWTRS